MSKICPSIYIHLLQRLKMIIIFLILTPELFRTLALVNKFVKNFEMCDFRRQIIKKYLHLEQRDYFNSQQTFFFRWISSPYRGKPRQKPI